MNPPKVCIVGLKCFDHISGNPVPRYLGGIETQLVVLAKGLVKAGCEVSLITYDHGQKELLQFSGVKVFKCYPPDGGWPGLRWLWRSRRLWQAMRDADADVYLQMGAGHETGQVAMGCQDFAKPRKRFVFCLASDANYGPHLRMGKLGWEGMVYKYGLRCADLIFAQTIRQQEGLRKAMKLESEVIPMAAVSPLAPGIAPEPRSGSPRILWVGRITPGKRLEWLLEAARQCPEFRFDVVGTPNKDSDYATGLMQAAARLPNVKAHGRLAGEALNKLYQTAQVLCCTSTLEGFPTTFLEAWSCGIPVVTTFDPDGIVARHGLGKVAASSAEVVSHLREVLKDEKTRSHFGEAARRCYTENHTVEAVSHRFRRALEKLLEKKR